MQTMTHSPLCLDIGTPLYYPISVFCSCFEPNVTLWWRASLWLDSFIMFKMPVPIRLTVTMKSKLGFSHFFFSKNHIFASENSLLEFCPVLSSLAYNTDKLFFLANHSLKNFWNGSFCAKSTNFRKKYICLILYVNNFNIPWAYNA